MRFTLRHREGTETFHRIMNGRHWVGRVCQHENGTWIGVIGKLMTTGHLSRDNAFDEVVARHLGYSSADAMRGRHRQVRQAQRLANRAADHIASELLRGNFRPLDKALELGPEGMTLALRGVTRTLRKDRRSR